MDPRAPARLPDPRAGCPVTAGLLAALGAVAYLVVGFMFVGPLVHLYAIEKRGEDSLLAGPAAFVAYGMAWPLAAAAAAVDIGVRAVGRRGR